MAPKSTIKKQETSRREVLRDFHEAYQSSVNAYYDQIAASPRLWLIDTFAAILVLVGICQLAFVIMVRSNFPFNAFLSGFIICVGQFVLLMSLRMQMVQQFPGISKQRAFGEFVLASLVLQFICIHFIN